MTSIPLVSMYSTSSSLSAQNQAWSWPDCIRASVLVELGEKQEVDLFESPRKQFQVEIFIFNLKSTFWIKGKERNFLDFCVNFQCISDLKQAFSSWKLEKP